VLGLEFNGNNFTGKESLHGVNFYRKFSSGGFHRISTGFFFLIFLTFIVSSILYAECQEESFSLFWFRRKISMEGGISEVIRKTIRAYSLFSNEGILNRLQEILRRIEGIF